MAPHPGGGVDEMKAPCLQIGHGLILKMLLHFFLLNIVLTSYLML